MIRPEAARWFEILVARDDAFVALDFQPLALAAGALAFAALGAALGALAREVRVATLLAVLLALPLAFLALIPSGAVNATLFDALNIVSGAFPFKPTLRALDGEAAAYVHLVALAAAYGAVARLGLRRF